jgi:hypothetical protein
LKLYILNAILNFMDKKQILKITKEFKKIKNTLNERTLRLWAAERATQLGHGGTKILCKITKLSRKTIYNGKKELKFEGGDFSLPVPYIRKTEAERKRVEDKKLLSALYSIFKIGMAQKMCQPFFL